MKIKSLLFYLAVVVFIMVTFSAFAGQISILHDFNGGGDDGRWPYSSLTMSGDMFYGVTQHGGDSDQGTVFKISTDGTGFTLLHEFTSWSAQGQWPVGELTLSGGTLYGMTMSGGDTNKGAIYSVGADGGSFTVLHNFQAGSDDGWQPMAGMTLTGSSLYGMTYRGGDYDEGTIFRINTDGSGFTMLHDFLGGSNDGFYPKGPLSYSDGWLYGTTYEGGQDYGVVFKIDTSGSGFTLLHKFNPFVGDDGNDPEAGVLVSGSTLYGMTNVGGGTGKSGVIYTMDTTGSGYTVLHRFVVGDGSGPKGDLTISEGKLYGTTRVGGDSNYGVIFEMTTDGAGYTILHEFLGAPDDGKEPYTGSLKISDNILYGMTVFGGDSDYGVVFSLNTTGDIPEPSTLLLLVPFLVGFGWWYRRRKLVCHSRALRLESHEHSEVDFASRRVLLRKNGNLRQ
ncbi:choice-of-anchor tandem repeat GloVer-containing protein [Candidatus Auribacterota bacterium]